MTSPLDILATKGRSIDVPRGGGVYVMIDDTGDIVYVGQSANVWRRVSSHVFAFERFIFIATDRRWRLKYERALIRAFLPRFNTKIPGPRTSDARALERLGLDLSLIDEVAAERRRAPDIANRRRHMLRMWQSGTFDRRKARAA